MMLPCDVINVYVYLYYSYNYILFEQKMTY